MPRCILVASVLSQVVAYQRQLELSSARVKSDEISSATVQSEDLPKHQHLRQNVHQQSSVSSLPEASKTFTSPNQTSQQASKTFPQPIHTPQRKSETGRHGPSEPLKVAEEPPAHLDATSKIFLVPTTWRCIVLICCQLMVVYMLLAFCRTNHELRSTAKGRVEAGLSAAAQTLTYGPMLCVLFIACQMRAESLSDGKDQPQSWVQTCMYTLTFALLMSTLLVFVIQLFTGKPRSPNTTPFDLGCPQEEQIVSSVELFALTAMRYLILFVLYGGLAGVIVGICTYSCPGSKNAANSQDLPPAIACTIILAMVFFSMQLIIAVCRSYSEHTRVHFPQIVGIMNAAAATAEFAPMLAVLFLAALMRALQHDAQPQEWAHNCMFASTGAMCVTALLGITVPLTLGGTLKTNPFTNASIVEVPKPMIGYIFIALRYLCMLCFYGGAGGVIVSIFAFESPGGRETTLPIPPTIQCVVNLTCQFFFVYFVLTVMITSTEVTGGVITMEKWSLYPAVEAARSTMTFAPMLSIIFVATRMYALAITDNKGSPPVWVQDCMYVATWTLQISGLICLASGLFMGRAEADWDGNVVNKFSNWYLGIVSVAMRYISMLFLYGAMSMVILGLFTMTPESANGHGSFADVYGGAGPVNAMPFASRPSQIAISTVHTLVQMGSL